MSVSIALVGLGNIGSQTAALLSGIEEIRRIVLIDPDRYEPSNLGRQRIGPADIGRRKVDVQARMLRKSAPHLRVERHAQTVQSLPLGMLRDCVILGCVDSRDSRQAINARAFALGTPWIDAALDRDGQVRARVYTPGTGDCLECSWGPADYRLLEQRMPCAVGGSAGSAGRVGASAAPQELGAVAAGIQIALLRRVLSGTARAVDGVGRQWFFDVASGRGWVGAYGVNPHCRLDHHPWRITAVGRGAAEISLREACGLVGGDARGSELALDGQIFVRRMRCARCGAERRTALHAYGRIGSHACRRCKAHMESAAIDASDVLRVGGLPAVLAAAPLAQFGFVDGDVFTLRSGGATAHFQLGRTPAGG